MTIHVRLILVHIVVFKFFVRNSHAKWVLYHLSREWRIFSLYILLFNHLFANFVQWVLSIFTPPNSFQIHHLLLSSKFVFCFSPIKSNLCCSYIQGFMRSTVICFTCSTTFYYKSFLKTFFPHFIYVSQFLIAPSTFHFRPTFSHLSPPSTTKRG